MRVEYDSNFRLYENGTVTITPARTFYGSHDEKRRAGLTDKKYRIDGARYRKISSSAVNLYRNKKNKVIFITLTFPDSINEKQANECFSRWIDNMKLNYKLNAYVATKELTKKGRPHFHILADFPYVSIRKINDSWCSAISPYCRYSNNAVRLPVGRGKAIVKDLHRCVSYISKYVSKSRFSKDGHREIVEFDARCFFISHNIVSRPIWIDWELCQKLAQKYRYSAYEHTYCEIIVHWGIGKDYSLIEELFKNYRETFGFD